MFYYYILLLFVQNWKLKQCNRLEWGCVLFLKFLATGAVEVNPILSTLTGVQLPRRINCKDGMPLRIPSHIVHFTKVSDTYAVCSLV